MDNQILDATTGTLKTLVDGTVRLVLEFSPTKAQDAMSYFGKHGTTVAIATLTDETGQTIMREELTKKPSWQRDLYQSSFFRNPKVWPHIGTDKDFLVWVRLQPCIVCGKEMPSEAAHVRRVANGAGTGIKPPYSAVPLCHAHHTKQHAMGELAVLEENKIDEVYKYFIPIDKADAKEKFNKWRIQCVHKWCWESLKGELGFKSWADMPEALFNDWKDVKGL